MHKKQILLNNNSVNDEKNNVLLFDVVKILPFKKSYRIELSENGKFSVIEILKNETNKKIAKIIK